MKSPMRVFFKGVINDPYHCVQANTGLCRTYLGALIELWKLRRCIPEFRGDGLVVFILRRGFER